MIGRGSHLIGAKIMGRLARGSSGAGRAKLRLSRGFPRRTRQATSPPLNHSFERPPHARPLPKDRKRVTRKFTIGSRAAGNDQIIQRGFWGMTLSGEAKREAPVRAEPHPTRSFAPPAPGLPALTRRSKAKQQIPISNQDPSSTTSLRLDFHFITPSRQAS
jgi:hypothetical protein